MGTPPANERDLLIVQGLQKFAGRGHLNCKSRYSDTIRPPDPRPWDSNAPKIIASSIIAMVVVLVITWIRIVGKVQAKRSRLGWDDWLIMFASVCHSQALRMVTDSNLIIVRNTQFSFLVFAACDIQKCRRWRHWQAYLQCDLQRNGSSFWGEYSPTCANLQCAH